MNSKINFTATNKETGEQVRLYKGHKAFDFFNELPDDIKSKFDQVAEWWLSLSKEERRNYINNHLKNCWTTEKRASMSKIKKDTPHWTKGATQEELINFRKKCAERWTDYARKEKGKQFSKMWASMTDAQKEQHSSRVKAYYTDEVRKKKKELGLNFERSLSREYKELRSKKFKDAMTLERRLELRAKSKASYEAKSSEEKIAHRLNAKRAVAKGVSSGELELLKFVRECLPQIEVVGSCNYILDGKELDIFIPSMNLAIEYNGAWWHCDRVMDRLDNYEKFELCRRGGIRLIQIWEFDWLNKQFQVKELLKNAFGLQKGNVYARECEVKIVDAKTKNEFLNKLHMQGEDRSFLNLGLFKGSELHAVMTFRRSRSNSEIELSRYCGNVVGGFSKLLKHAISELKAQNIDEIYSYSDNMLFSGNVYESNGWEFMKEISPDYRVYYKGSIFHKSTWRKERIYERFPEFLGSGKTEWQMENEVHALRLWDCGKKKWKFSFTKEIEGE